MRTTYALPNTRRADGSGARNSDAAFPLQFDLKMELERSSKSKALGAAEMVRRFRPLAAVHTHPHDVRPAAVA